MAGIDYWRDRDMDISIGLNYPKGMSDVYSAVQSLLHARGKYIVSDEAMTVELAKSIVSNPIRDTTAYYLVDTDNAKIWAILRNAVEEDRIRVLGVFHGKIPESLPENMLIIDIGRSLHNKVSKPMVSSVSDAIQHRGKYPAGSQEEIFSAILTLCYEVVYQPEYKVFKKNVSDLVPKARAFDFMFNPPESLSDKSMGNATRKFIEDIHEYMV